MAMLALLLSAIQAADSGSASTPPCTASQLSLSIDGKDGRSAGTQRSGALLSIRNYGSDCTLPALPRIEFLDRRGRALPVTRAVPIGMHPGPVMLPVRVAGGHRASADLTWMPGSVGAGSAPLRADYLRIRIGTASLLTRFVASVGTRRGQASTFTQAPLRAVEGMAAG